MMIKAAATRPEGQLNSSQHTTSSNPSFFQTHLDNFDDLLPFIIKISMPPFPLLSQFLSFSQSQVNEEQALQFRLRLVEGIATSIQACHDNGCQYIAKCTLQPLLTSLLAQNVPSLLVSSYFQVRQTTHHHHHDFVFHKLTDFQRLLLACFPNFKPHLWSFLILF